MDNSLMLVKSEYEALRNLLERVETKGVVEARALAILAGKLEHRVKSWFDGHPTGYAPPADPIPLTPTEAPK